MRRQQRLALGAHLVVEPNAYSLPRQNNPLPSRTLTRPLELTVNGPLRRDTDAPRFDTFNHELRPTRIRLRNTKPMPQSMRVAARSAVPRRATETRSMLIFVQTSILRLKDFGNRGIPCYVRG